MAKKPIIEDGQYLLHLKEVRERLDALAKLMDRETDLRQRELALRNELKEVRRKLKENRWDQRNLAAGAMRDRKAVVITEETADGRVIP